MAVAVHNEPQCEGHISFSPSVSMNVRARRGEKKESDRARPTINVIATRRARSLASRLLSLGWRALGRFLCALGLTRFAAIKALGFRLLVY